MKKAIFTLAILASFNLYSQQVQHHLTATPQKQISENQLRSTSQTQSSADEVVIWHEDFENGLLGSNISLDSSWSTSGADGDIWQKDTDGLSGNFNAGDIPLQSETADNGWMIFDCDASNTDYTLNNDGDTVSTAMNQVVQERSGQLTSPYIDLTNESNVTLSFQHAYRWCCYSSHEILVSVSNDDGVIWNDFIINGQAEVNQGVSTTTNIVLSDIAANEDSVLIRFDWSGGEETASHYYWMIDDVKIVETPAYSSLLFESNFYAASYYFGATSYTNIPLSQAASSIFFFNGTIENQGVNDLENAQIYGYIESENFYSQSEGSTIASQNRDTLYCIEDFIPEAEGQYDGSVYGLDTTNNIYTDTANHTLIVSTFDYARDRADFNTNYGRSWLNAEGDEQRGNTFDIYADGLLYAISAYFDEGTTPTATAKAILNTRDTIPPYSITYLENTNSLIVGQNTDNWVNFVFDTPISVQEGQVLVATILAEYNGADTVMLATSGISSPGVSMLQDITGEQGETGTWYYTPSTPLVRLNFDPNATAIKSYDENNFKVYPNPNSGIFTIDLKNKLSRDYSISIQNILGQQVYFEKYKKGNNIQKNIDLSFLDKGVYNINVFNENNVVDTQKIIIK